MATERKGQAVKDMVQEARTTMRTLFIDRPVAWWQEARVKMRDLPKTNFELGCAFAERGKWFDAMFRFRICAYFQPEYPQVWYNLGCSYFKLEKLPQAIAALKKAVQQNSGAEEALFMLAAIDPASVPASQRPTRMPSGMLQDFFSGLAATYDLEEARSRYQAGPVMHALAQPFAQAANPVVLDLCCGTGISVRPWRAAAKTIIGVDRTAAMLEMAGKATHADKKLFDELIAADVTQLPPSIAAGSADVVQLINAAHFVGELSGVVQGAARVLAADGVLVLTLEPHNAPVGYGLNAATGRFGHSAAYVKQVAADAGLNLVHEAPVKFYPELPVVQAFIFRKGGA